MVDTTGFDTGFKFSTTAPSHKFLLQPLRNGNKNFGVKILGTDSFEPRRKTGNNMFFAQGKAAEILLEQTQSSRIKEMDKYIDEVIKPIYPFVQRTIHNGEVYLINAQYALDNRISGLSYSNETSFGISIGTSRKGTLKIGKVVTYGLNLDYASRTNDLRETYGYNLADGIYELGYSITNLIKSLNSSKDLVHSSKLLDLYSRVYSYNNQSKPIEENNSLYKATMLRNFKRDQKHKLYLRNKIPSSIRSNYFNQTLEDLNENLEEEIEWRKKMKTGNTQVVEDIDLQIFIQDLCDHVGDVYDLPKELRPECYVSASPVPNAYSLPGGKLFFMAGIIGILEDLDSLLAVVGHEIAHYVARHVSKRMDVIKPINLGLNTLVIFQNIWALQGGNKPFSEVPLLKQVMDNWYFNSVGSSMYSSLGLEIAMKVPIMGFMMYSRSHEKEADTLGQEAAFLAGSDTNAMAQGWQNFYDFKKRIGQGDPGFLQKLMASHPEALDRKQRILERGASFSKEAQELGKSNRLEEVYYLA